VPEQPETEPEQTEATVPAEPDSADEASTSEPDAEPEPEPVRTLERLAADARYSATGKRKTAVARVIIRPGSGQFELNGRSLEVYFPRRVHQTVVRQPLDIVGFSDRVDVRARIHGGGISGQADAVRHGIAKALIEADPALRGELKRRQLLTRDPREKERRKAGLKKARKRPQFSKR
jgi:small subunit ribosomal protein S9